MNLTGGVAVAGAVAVLLSAFTGIGGWWLSKRTLDVQERRDEELQKAPYLEQLQAWSQRLLKEEADRRTSERAECEERLARERADRERRLARLEVDHERRVKDLEAQWGARLLVAQRREAAWRRQAEGAGGEPPP